MENPPAYDLADPWTKLKDQDGDLTFKGSQGVREYFARKGIDMTKKEAAKELDVSVRTIENYMSKGRLKGDGNGSVDDESVAAYKAKRDANLAAMQPPQKSKPAQQEPKHIDDYLESDSDNTEYIVTKGELLEAIKVAQELAYKEGYAQCRRDMHREKLTTKDLLQLVSTSQRELCETGRI